MTLKDLLPIIIIQYGFAAIALVDLFRHKKTRNLSVGIWTIIILLVGMLGPLLYFTVGRDDE